MDATFGWAGAGQQVDDYFSRQIGCSRFEMDDAFLGACFGQQQCDGIGGEAGMCQVSSNFGGAGGCSADVEGYPLAFLSSGTGVFDASLIDAALLAFSRELGDSGAVSNGAMFSSYSCTTVGNMSSGESNNYSGGSHDAEVLSPTSIMSAMSPITPPPPLFPHASSHQQAVHPKRKVPDEYTSSAAPTEPPPPTVPFPQPGCAKRRAGAAATTSICFGVRDHGGVQDPAARHEPDTEAMAQVKELIYRAAAMRPVSLGPDPEAVAAEKPRRKNVRISSDPQTVAARLRRERVSERLRVLQRLVPGGSKMDTASMLDEAASYLRFLKSQVQELETLGTTTTNGGGSSRSSASQRCNYHNSSSPGFLGFARSSNISHAGYVNPEGSNATTSNKLLH